jgi:hypothetical protein
MQHDVIRVRGTFRYVSAAALDRALAIARVNLDDDEFADADEWLDTFAVTGRELHADTTLPFAADRFVAAAVLESLASAAIGGVIELRNGDRPIDFFAAAS